MPINHNTIEYTSSNNQRDSGQIQVKSNLATKHEVYNTQVQLKRNLDPNDDSKLKVVKTAQKTGQSFHSVEAASSHTNN